MPRVGVIDEDRTKRLAAAAASINKRLGAGTMVKASDLAAVPLQRFPSGSLGLDVILGGGWPAGAVIEVFGKESSGKTTVCLKTVAENQQRDPAWSALWVAAEEFDHDYAKTLGIDRERLFIFQGNVMEEVYGFVLAQVDEGNFDQIVIDSLPALVPEREDAEKNVFGDVEVGLGARRTNSFLRRLGRACDRRAVFAGTKRPTTLFFINQPRVIIGGFSRYGTPTTTPGGAMKNYAASVRVEVSRVEYIKDHDDYDVGQKIKAIIRKNKTSPPMRSCEFDFYFDSCAGHEAGTIDQVQEVTSIALARGIFSRAGAWYSYGDQKWQGQEGVKEALREDPKLFSKVSEEVLRAARSLTEVGE